MGMSIKEIQVGVEYKIRSATYYGIEFESLTRYSKNKSFTTRRIQDGDEYKVDVKGSYLKTTTGRYIHITQVEGLYSTYARRFAKVEAPAAEVVEVEAPAQGVVKDGPIKLKVTAGMTPAERDEWWTNFAREYARQARAEWSK